MNKNISQSSNHLLMIEPSAFYANPETMDTNAYQNAESIARDVTYKKALQEYRAFRDKLSEKGVLITQMRGYEECPDMVFPNCMSTHRKDGKSILYLYPMLNENRRAEHSDELIATLQKSYDELRDWRYYADQGLHLESTASICRDRVNDIGYAALSPRTNKELATKWMEEMDYTPILFETKSHAGIPVYHTDCTMWIGSTLAGLCSPCITEEYRDTVLNSLRENRAVVEFTMEQLRTFCGNALEVRGFNGSRNLAISTGAYNSLRDDQLKIIHDHFDDVIHSELSTLETYGGGSARCMLMELF